MPAYFAFSFSFGRLLVQIVASNIPTDQDELERSGFWRNILFFPFVWLTLLWLSMKFYLKSEPLKYLVLQRQFKEAKELIDVIYHFSEDTDTILHYVSVTSHRNTMNLNTFRLFTSPTYKKSTYILTVLSMMHGISGYGFIYVFEKLSIVRYLNYESGNEFFTYNEAMWLVSLISFLSAVGAVTFLNLMKRKTLLMLGLLLSAILLILIAVTVVFEAYMFSVYLFMLYLVVFYLNLSTCFWVYITESSTDCALGFSAFVIYMSLLIIVVLG